MKSFIAASVFTTAVFGKGAPDMGGMPDLGDLGDLGGLGGMPGMGGEGGMPGGMPGMGGGLGGLEEMFKLETNCPLRKCGDGERLIQKALEKDGDDVTNGFGAVGCSGGGMAAMLSPGKTPGGKSKAETCCQKREVCMQTCGFTKKKCENDFNACVKVRCSPTDSSCSMDSKMNYVMEEMMGSFGGGPDAAAEPAAAGKCGPYAKQQEAMCECVDEADFDEKFEAWLKSFYEIYAPEKADDIDMDKIYSKFKKGKEADIVYAMITKYKKEGTIQKREKGSDPLKDLMGGMGGLGGMGGAGGDMPDMPPLGGDSDNLDDEEAEL